MIIYSLTALFRGLPLGYIFTCVLATTILGMAGHDLVTQFLVKPPNTMVDSLGHYFGLAIFIIHILQALAAIILFDLIDQHWSLKKFWVKVIAFALLLAVINENFLRRFLMEIIADHRNPGYEFLMVAFPMYVTFIAVSWITAAAFFQQNKLWYKGIALILVALSYQYLPDFLQQILTTCVTLNPGGQFTQGPYGLNVLVAIYATYLIPVMGMYIAYLWTRESLPKRCRSLLFFILLVGVHGQFLGVLQIVTSQGSLLQRFFYYGSFWWQLLIVAYTIVFFVERKFYYSDANIGKMTM